MSSEKRYTQDEVEEIVRALEDELVALEARYSESLDEINYLNKQLDTVNNCHDAMLAFLSEEGIDWNCGIY